MLNPLNELKNDATNLKIIQRWLENNPGKTEQDLLKILNDINDNLTRSGKWLDAALEKIKHNDMSGNQ